MTIRKPRHSQEEFARRGQEIDERAIEPNLQPEDDGKFVAIDIESGNCDRDRDDYTTTNRLRDRCPDPQTWLMRLGEPVAYRIGHRQRG